MKNNEQNNSIINAIQSVKRREDINRLKRSQDPFIKSFSAYLNQRQDKVQNTKLSDYGHLNDPKSLHEAKNSPDWLIGSIGKMLWKVNYYH